MKIEKQLYRMTLSRLNDLISEIEQMDALLRSVRGNPKEPLDIDISIGDLADIREYAEKISRFAHEFNAYFNSMKAAPPPPPKKKRRKARDR